MIDFVFIWGMVVGACTVGVFYQLDVRRLRRRLQAAERWAAELEARAEEMWEALRR